MEQFDLLICAILIFEERYVIIIFIIRTKKKTLLNKSLNSEKYNHPITVWITPKKTISDRMIAFEAADFMRLKYSTHIKIIGRRIIKTSFNGMTLVIVGFFV